MNFLKEKSSYFLKKVDFLGPQIGFEYDNSTNFKSISGGCYSLCVIVRATVIGFMFSKDLYQRKKPISISNKVENSYSRVEFSNFPVVFSAGYNGGNSNYPYEFLDIQFYVFTVTEKNTFDIIIQKAFSLERF